MTEPAVLTVRDLHAYYRPSALGGSREIKAVDDVSLTIGRNEIYGLAGESGSGKTTLIRTIAGAIRPPLRVVSGDIMFNFAGRQVAMQSAGPDDLASIRWKHLSYVMQGSMSVLNPVRRVRQSFIDFAWRHIGGSTAEFLAAVRAHIGRLDLAPRVLDAYPHELSGGMRQRLVIALATICRPDFIIADEPTTALDVVVQKSVLAMIRSVQQELGSSMLFVTHDLAVHANLTDRLGIMYAGTLVEEATTAALFRQPLHPYTKHLVGSLPNIGSVSPDISLGGRPPSLAAPPPGCRFHPRCPIAMPRCGNQIPPMRIVADAHRVACFAVGDDA